MRKRTVLMVDDEVGLRRIIARELEEEGYRMLLAGSGEEALRLLTSERDVGVLLLDLMLPDMTGLEVLSRINAEFDAVQTIIITAYGNVETAVNAMKLGAFDYICKPVRLEELKLSLDRVFTWVEMKEENTRLKALLASSHDEEVFLGKSPAMERVSDMIVRVADSDVTVLLEGESGTGKTMLAKIIHEKSRRSDRPFITVNCAAIPEKLLESELFGHVKGAFTGATENRPGKFSAANGGTLFLDEVTELPLPLQAKLLQFTQEKCFSPLGSNKIIHVDVRIIAATNRDLLKMVQEGSFREDLYYRLNTISLRVPPLRERREDIPLFVARFLSEQEAKLGRTFQIDTRALEMLMSYDWPGNIRELKNAIERVTVLARDEKICLKDFFFDLQQGSGRRPSLHVSFDKPLAQQVAEFEKALIVEALNRTNGSQAKSARLLKVSRQNLLYKMQKYGLLKHCEEDAP